MSLRSRHRRARRLALLTACGSMLLAAATLAACSDDTTSSTGGGSEAGTDSSRSEGGSVDSDGGANADAADAAPDAKRDANVRDANGPGEAGAECSFNRDCQLALRCECDENTGCACAAGTRGTGENGVDPCLDGNACASALCIEGPPDSGSFCSDECTTSNDCTGKLPLCSDIAFVGRVCIRTPPL